MKLTIRHQCADFDTYRAARVKSLFNCEDAANFSLDVELPIDQQPWRLGVIVGPSGSGKTSLGAQVFGPDACYRPTWPAAKPIIDAIAPHGDFDAVTAALAAVGLGSVPAWLRPYRVLSNGEQFRAMLARLIAEAPQQAVVDEFSSVVDRQIARIGALAFGKAWRRTSGQAVLLSCHYDVLDWLEPDWVFDTGTLQFHGRWLRRRPPFELEIYQTGWKYWPLFEPHHYLKLPRMVAAKCFVGFVAGEPVCHLGVSSANIGKGELIARACRLVVMPEWQGAGVGLRFLNEICRWQLAGDSRAHLAGRKASTLFHTSHPGLAAALRRQACWRQVSSKLYGARKDRSAASLARARQKSGKGPIGTGYGGHFRAVQGFRFLGDGP